MEERPSQRELDDMMKKTAEELKYKGVYDELRKRLLADIDHNDAYQDLLQRVKDFSNRFFYKSKFVEGEKGLIRQRLKTALNDSNNINRHAADLARDLVSQCEDTKVRKHIEESNRKYFGLEHESENDHESEGGERSSLAKGRFENTFVPQEDNSNTCSSFPTTSRPDSSAFGPAHSESSNLEPEVDTENSNSGTGFQNVNEKEKGEKEETNSQESLQPVSFSIVRRTMLEMDKISDDEDLDDVDESSLPSPPKFEQFSPHNPLLEEDSMDAIDRKNLLDDRVEMAISSGVIPILASMSTSGSMFSSAAFSTSRSVISESLLFQQISESSISNLSSSAVEINADVQHESVNIVAEGFQSFSDNFSLAKNEFQSSAEVSEDGAFRSDDKIHQDDKKGNEEKEDRGKVILKRKRKEQVQTDGSFDMIDAKKSKPGPESGKVEPSSLNDETPVRSFPETSISTPLKKIQETSQSGTPKVRTRESKNQAEILLDMFIADDSKRNYSDCEVSDCSSVHSSDLTQFDSKVYFSDSDCEILYGQEVDTLRMALEEPEKFAQKWKEEEEQRRNMEEERRLEDESRIMMRKKAKEDEKEEEKRMEIERRMKDEEVFIEDSEEDKEEVEKVSTRSQAKGKRPTKKTQRSSKNIPEVKKEVEDFDESKEETVSRFRRSSRRTISSSTDSSLPSRVNSRVETPDSSLSVSRSNSISEKRNPRKRARALDRESSLDSVDSLLVEKLNNKKKKMANERSEMKVEEVDKETMKMANERPEGKVEEGDEETVKRGRGSRIQLQSYDTSDLYKPRTSIRSSRRSIRNLDPMENPPSPLSTASNSTS